MKTLFYMLYEMTVFSVGLIEHFAASGQLQILLAASNIKPVKSDCYLKKINKLI